MKSANQIYVDNKVKIEIICNDCGNRPRANSGINTKAVKKALSFSYRSCNPPTFLLVNVGCWMLDVGWSLDLIQTPIYMVL